MIILYGSIFILVMTVFVNYYNNKELLEKEKGKERWNAFFRPRKNTVLTFLFGFLGGEILFFCSYYFYQDTFFYAVKLLFAYELILAAAYVDHKKQIIPNFLILVLLLGAISFCTFEIVILQLPPMLLFKEYVVGAVFGGGVFLLSMLFVKNGVGMGDVKLFAALGLLLGWSVTFNLLFFTVLISAIYGMVLLIRKKANKKLLLPLAPFAYIGMVITILLGV